MILLVGCSATGPAFVAEQALRPNEAVIYIYRPSAMTARARTATIEMDGKLIGQLDNNGYIVIHALPGKHRITESWAAWVGDLSALQRPIEVLIDAESGMKYYVRLSSRSELGGGGVTLQWSLSEMPAEPAAAEIVQCKRQGDIVAEPATRMTASNPAVSESETSGDNGAVPEDAANKKPVVLAMQLPEYPFTLRKSRIEAVVTIQFVVGVDGRARDLNIINSPDPQFDAAIRAAATDWRFEPGTRDGYPVNVRMTMPITFSLTPDKK
ncbi:MAG TPA: TonB family protein [Opitutaceae bacterium]|nr:TonB family protein [Opitutaceae bacterium]